MCFLSLILFLFFGFAPLRTIANFTRALAPGTIEIIGAATATVNGNPAYRHGEFYQYPLPIPNASAPIWQSVTVAVSDAGLSTNGNILFPAYGQTFSYDLDGNRKSDGVWNYVWDAENRLIQVSNSVSVASTARKKLDFSYDHLGRRYRKIVSTWNGTAWIAAQTNYFFHDGWLLVAETSPGVTTKTYLWGVDLSGLPAWRGNAAGVGGLVAMKYGADSYYPAFDGNGNVMALVGSADGKIKAQYEYGPFAEVIRVSGSMAEINPWRYSGKYTDDETGLSYYGYRYYSPSLGRWLNRDPIAEQGGINVYAFVQNSPVALFDRFGLLPTPWEGLNIGLDVTSLTVNLSNGNVPAAFVDMGGLLFDGGAFVAPIPDPGAGTIIRAYRAAEALRAVEAVRFADKAIDEAKFVQKVVKIPEAKRAAFRCSAPEGLKAELDALQTAKGSPVRPGQTGTYGELKAQKEAFGETEALDMDHQPSFAAQVRAREEALGVPLTKAELAKLKESTPAVASPRAVHQQTSPTYGGRNTPAQIAKDAADLNAAAARDRAAFDEAMNNRR